jgi:hypothetical protein
MDDYIPCNRVITDLDVRIHGGVDNTPECYVSGWNTQYLECPRFWRPTGHCLGRGSVVPISSRFRRGKAEEYRPSSWHLFGQHQHDDHGLLGLSERAGVFFNLESG